VNREKMERKEYRREKTEKGQTKRGLPTTVLIAFCVSSFDNGKMEIGGFRTCCDTQRLLA
jgi:hypothetical protein